MRRMLSLLAAMSICGLLAGVDPVAAAEKRIRLRDDINHAWFNELVTYTVRFEAGACRVQSIVLFGPEGWIIKVQGDFGRNYGFLSHENAAAQMEAGPTAPSLRR
jgi:hypothetical protein